MKFHYAPVAVLLASTGVAQLDISIGVRETGFAGGAFTFVGDNGGTSGGIEWVNLDGQQLVLDGTWQQFVFVLGSDPITGFAGGSANSTLEGDFGVLEHIRIQNLMGSGVDGPITLWIDDVENITASGGSNVFATFEGFADGQEVMFQEAPFSGSTAGNMLSGVSGATNAFALNGTGSMRADMEFVDNAADRWCRLTSFRTTQQLGNPLIRFDDNSIITFWMAGLNCPAGDASISAACPAGPHSGGGPLMGVSGTPQLGGSFFVTGDNLLASPLCGLLIGTETPPIDLSLVGGPVGSNLCIAPIATAPCSGSVNTTLQFNVGADIGLCGLTLSMQWIDFDASLGVGLPFGTSEVLNIVVGA